MEPEEQIGKMSRRSLLWGAGALAAGYTGWKWFVGQDAEGGLLAPLRKGLSFNEGVMGSVFSQNRLSTTFEPSRIEPLRINGDIGLGDDGSDWRLSLYDGKRKLILSLDQIKNTLPKREFITELRCVEGWSRVFRWGGVGLGELLAKYAPGASAPFVGMSTPNDGYYVGLDWPSVTHPQTLLCFEMNGKPLTPEHGAPLRLAMPVKYGYKQLKRIGTIQLASKRPADYWADRGYDWYAGL